MNRVLARGAQCTPDDVVCAIRELSESLERNPWIDAIPTLVATLFGAVVGAFFAWLFSRNLATQERRIRQQELSAAREERAIERQADYEDLMRREWPLLITVFRDFSNAERARVEAAQTGTPSAQAGLERVLNAMTAATDRLYVAASVAKGRDHDVVNLAGRITSVYVPYSIHGVETLSEVSKLLIDFVVTPPAQTEEARETLVTALQDLLDEALAYSRSLD